MRNFVIQYRFENSKGTELFKNLLESNYDRLRKQSTEEYTYYLIAEFNLPALADSLGDINDRFMKEGLLSDGDYIAVYFIDGAEPDLIKREMVLGKDYYLENDMKKAYLPQHDAVLNDLLSFDFVRQR
jgi:hypothetical protein